MQSYKINENITLHYIPMTKLKTTRIGIYIGRKLCEVEASANAVLPHVLLKGCQKAKSAAEIAKTLQNLYGAKLYASVNKRGDNQFMNFEGEVISDRYAAEGEKLLSGLLGLMLSVLFEPITQCGGFLADILEREKVNACDRLKSIINDKTRYANNRCIEEMFKGELYSISEWGTAEGIEKIKPKALFEHYKRVISESAINIFLSGEADFEEVKAEIISRTAGREFKKASLADVDIIKKAEAKKELSETTDLTQGKLAIGFRTNVAPADADYWALIVANNIFGGGMGSKLFNNVREKLSLAYYVRTNIDRQKGFMLLYAGIAFDKLKDAEDEIFLQLDEMVAGNITDAEIENAKSEIENSLNACYDDQSQLQSYFLGNIIAGVPVSIEEYKENIRKITKEEIVAVMRKLEPDTLYFLKGEE